MFRDYTKTLQFSLFSSPLRRRHETLYPSRSLTSGWMESPTPYNRERGRWSSRRSRISIQIDRACSQLLDVWEQAARVVLSLFHTHTYTRARIVSRGCDSKYLSKRVKIAQCQPPERAAVFRFTWRRTRDKLCDLSVTCRQQSWITLRIRWA